MVFLLPLLYVMPCVAVPFRYLITCFNSDVCCSVGSVVWRASLAVANYISIRVLSDIYGKSPIRDWYRSVYPPSGLGLVGLALTLLFG